MKPLVIVALAVLFPTAVYGAVRITEIAWMGVVGANGQYGEWIELYNDGAAVDLAGWSLYSGGGTDMVFTLSKTIPSQSYLLIERTTNSMPDPVPTISDEAGSFGGGGLSNGGEHLVMKDASATTIQDINFSAGWPAGDANTKHTMQWNGSRWITAPPTPKAPFEKSTDSTTDVPPQQEPIKQTKKERVETDSFASIVAPSEIFPHVEYKFLATVQLTDGTKNPRRGIYRWNFGDGTSIVQDDHIGSVSHSYAYPGTYTVWFGYYDSIFSGEPLLADTFQADVYNPQFTVSVVNADAIKIQNETDSPIDLSNWMIVSGENSAKLPPMTIVAGAGTIVIRGSTIGLTIKDTLAIAAPDGYRDELIAKKNIAPPQAVSGVHTPSVPNEPQVKGEGVVAEDTVVVGQEGGLETNAKSRAKAYIFGAAAVAIIGLFLFLERFMARQE